MFYKKPYSIYAVDFPTKNSRKDLSDENLRIRDQKINNPSALDTSTEDDDEDKKSAVTKAKQARKIKKQNESKTKMQRTKEIIQAHQKSKKKNLKKYITTDTHSGDDSLSEKDEIEENLSDPENNKENGRVMRRDRRIISETDSENDMFGDPSEQYIEPIVIINKNNFADQDTNEDNNKV
ncbi:hypothetical protein KQX54_021315 [Cotesia glomerata]|uniref:Uncharacterized protein n=1 Tax=Cotesia glomerata TaxID=32391 RepID=A0AAV7J9H6_COTGL|nr:hypothetical protein KQX54_021315 [Cotesia glomerata]